MPEVFTLDGARFDDLDGFWDEVERVLIPGKTWGRNLDAFSDVLDGGFGLPAGSITVPAKTYLDLQLNYTLGKSTFYFGMDNALGTKAPRFDTNGTLVGTTGAGTAADVYDAIGRRYYVGVRVAL